MRSGATSRSILAMGSYEDTGRNQYPKASWVGIGIAIGLPVGAALGLAMENLAVGAGMGLLVGIVAGATIEAHRNNAKE